MKKTIVSLFLMVSSLSADEFSKDLMNYLMQRSYIDSQELSEYDMNGFENDRYWYIKGQIDLIDEIRYIYHIHEG